MNAPTVDGAPRNVRIVEVGPRDGLQAEQGTIPTAAKVELVERLVAAGLRDVELTSFVSPRAVPQLADAADVAAGVVRHNGVRYWALVPNMRGYERAREHGIRDVAVFTAATDTFSRRNVNATIAETLERFRPVVEAARADGAQVRGYVSVAFGCPYEGEVAPSAVHEVSWRLLDLGVTSLSIGDTIGVAVPAQVEPVCGPVLDAIPDEALALHLHDTRGTALANVWEALQLGIRTFDSSAAGIGGCPFAPGATGNLATEDLVWFLHRNGFETGVDLAALLEVSRWLASALGRVPAGHVAAVRAWPFRDDDVS